MFFAKIRWLKLSVVIALSTLAGITLLFAADARNSVTDTNNQNQTDTNNAQTTGRPKQVAGIEECFDMNTCLRAITTNTFGTLRMINDMPFYLEVLRKMAESWLKHDETPTTQEMQENFAGIGAAIINNYTAQLDKQKELTIALVGPEATNNLTGKAALNLLRPSSPSILDKIPNLNDLVYSTVLNEPPIADAPGLKEAPMNYIQNASGIIIPHPIPGGDWTGEDTAKDRYVRYYKNVMAVQSFNGYVLSNLLANKDTNNDFVNLQNELVRQAGSSKWISEVSTNDLGIILRQLLVFQSQSYVLLTQLVQTQKDLLTAQAMTNSLLIWNNTNNETLMVSNARGE